MRNTESSWRCSSDVANRKIQRFSALVLLAFSLVSVASAATAESDSPTQPIIALSRLPGWKTPNYDIAIYRDGRVLYIGHANVVAQGERTSQLDKQTVDELILRFRTSGFLALQENYIIADLHDGGRVELVFRLEGNTKKVLAHVAATGGPGKLVATLAHEIDRAVGSRKWVRGD